MCSLSLFPHLSPSHSPTYHTLITHLSYTYYTLIIYIDPGNQTYIYSHLLYPPIEGTRTVKQRGLIREVVTSIDELGGRYVPHCTNRFDDQERRTMPRNPRYRLRTSLLFSCSEATRSTASSLSYRSWETYIYSHTLSLHIRTWPRVGLRHSDWSSHTADPRIPCSNQGIRTNLTQACGPAAKTSLLQSEYHRFKSCHAYFYLILGNLLHSR